MNMFTKANKRPTLCLPYGRTSEQPIRPNAATLSSNELKRIVAAMLG